MQKLASLSFLALALSVTTAAFPQPGPVGADRPCAAASGVGGPGAGCPGGMRRGGGMMGPGARWGSDYTPGWGMMSREEQQQHREKMLSFKDYGECKAYMEQQHALMAERAKERGRTVPAQPRRDACAPLAPKK